MVVWVAGFDIVKDTAFHNSLIPLLKNNKLLKEDEDILLKLMRTHEGEWRTKVSDATEVHKKAVRGVRYIADKVLDDSRNVGIFRSRLRGGPNAWMPRRWKWDMVNEYRDELAEIMVKSNAITLDDEALKRHLTPENLSQYKKIKARFDSFETILGRKDQPGGEGWSSQELIDLGDDVKLFEVFEKTRTEMSDFLKNNSTDLEGLEKEKLRAANTIIDEMLDKKNLIQEIDADTIGTILPSSFSPRSINSNNTINTINKSFACCYCICKVYTIYCSSNSRSTFFKHRN